MISVIRKYLKISFDGIETLMTLRCDALSISGVRYSPYHKDNNYVETLIFSHIFLSYRISSEWVENTMND